MSAAAKPSHKRSRDNAAPRPCDGSRFLAATMKKSAHTIAVAAGWNMRSSWLYHTKTGASATNRPASRPVVRPLSCVARRMTPQTISSPISTPKVRKAASRSAAPNHSSSPCQ